MISEQVGILKLSEVPQP